MNDLQQAPIWAHIDGRLERVQATKQELILGNAMSFYLEKLVVAFAKSGRQEHIKTKLLGIMSYSELTTGRGKRRYTQHTVTFTQEDYAFFYEEMRHALQIAIYALSGEPVSLGVDFEQKSAYWRFLAGSALSDVAR